MIDSSKPIRRSSRHLINILNKTRNHHPNFTLFLGAGASADSGIKTAKAMITEWRECMWETCIHTDGSDKIAFLQKQKEILQ